MLHISIVHFSILINGSFSGFCGSSRWLRQGDPLSLMLFGILMKALSCMLDAIVNDGILLGFSIGIACHTSMMVSRLLFADGTFIFCDVDLGQIAKLHDILLLIWENYS